MKKNVSSVGDGSSKNHKAFLKNNLRTIIILCAVADLNSKWDFN